MSAPKRICLASDAASAAEETKEEKHDLLALPANAQNQYNPFEGRDPRNQIGSLLWQFSSLDRDLIKLVLSYVTYWVVDNFADLWAFAEEFNACRMDMYHRDPFLGGRDAFEAHERLQRMIQMTAIFPPCDMISAAGDGMERPGQWINCTPMKYDHGVLKSTGVVLKLQWLPQYMDSDMFAKVHLMCKEGKHSPDLFIYQYGPPKDDIAMEISTPWSKDDDMEFRFEFNEQRELVTAKAAKGVHAPGHRLLMTSTSTGDDSWIARPSVTNDSKLAYRVEITPTAIACRAVVGNTNNPDPLPEDVLILPFENHKRMCEGRLDCFDNTFRNAFWMFDRDTMLSRLMVMPADEINANGADPADPTQAPRHERYDRIQEKLGLVTEVYPSGDVVTLRDSLQLVQRLLELIKQFGWHWKVQVKV